MEQKYFFVLVGIIAALIAISSCVKQTRPQDVPAEKYDVPAEKYCEGDADCACGVHIITQDCFYGNKKYVDTLQQCPDFCTGIAGNLGIKCVNNGCEQVSVRQN